MGFFSDIFDFVGDIFSEVIEWFVDIPDVPDYEDSAKGALVNKQSNLAQIPVVYGQRLVGGTRVFVETSGTDNQYLYIALVLCEGEVQSIGNVYINDTISTDAKFSGLVTIEKMLGTDSQAASSVLTAAPSWTSNHRLRGIAYLAIRLKWDRDVFGSLPDITAVVNGRKVYDPRSGSTYYSNNPALCLLDYMRNTRYGKGLPNSAFESNWQSWKDAADVCEYEVDAYDDVNAPSVQIFNCNTVIDTSKPLIDNVKILLSGMQGLLTYSQGKYKLVVEDEMPVGYTPYLFDEDNILGSITVNGIKKRSKYNRVVATFANPEKNWQQDQVEYPEGGSSEYTTLLAEDDNFEMEQRASLDTVTSVYQARNIAYTLLKRSRNNIRCSFMATIDSIQCEVGDIVNVRHKSLGWGYDVSGNVDDPKPFRITGLALQPDGNVGVTLAEHQDSIYAWYKGVEVDDYPDTNLPDPFSVQAITESTISVSSSEAINDNGSSTQRFLISWTDVSDNFVSEYIVQITENGTTDWDIEARTDSSPVMISGIKSGTSYNVRIKSVNSIGVSSGWVYLYDESSTTEAACDTAGNTWDSTLGLCLIPVAAADLTTEAGGGNTTYYQNDEPTGDLAEGDLWFDTDANNKIHRYSGSAWVAASGNLVGTTVTTGLSDIDPNIGTITAGTIQVGSSGVNIQSAATGSRITISSSKMEVYDGTTLRVKIGDLS